MKLQIRAVIKDQSKHVRPSEVKILYLFLQDRKPQGALLHMDVAAHELCDTIKW